MRDSFPLALGSMEASNGFRDSGSGGGGGSGDEHADPDGANRGSASSVDSTRTEASSLGSDDSPMSTQLCDAANTSIHIAMRQWMSLSPGSMTPKRPGSPTSTAPDSPHSAESRGSSMYSTADDAAAAVANGHADADSTDSNGRNSSDSASSHAPRPAAPSGADNFDDDRVSFAVPRPPDVAPPMAPPPPGVLRAQSSRDIESSRDIDPGKKFRGM